MDGINWAALNQQGNPFASFAEGLQRGADMRRERERDNLFRQQQAYKIEEQRHELAQDQENRLERGLVGHMARTDPQGAQRKAVEVGQFDLAEQIGKLDDQQRKAARERAQDLGGFAATLLQQPPEARKGIIAQAKPILSQMGFTPEQIDGFDPDDANLQALVASAMDVKTALEEQNRQRDDQRAAEKDKRDEAYRGQQLNLQRQRVGIAADANRRGWASFNERKKAGGFGTPGVSGGASAINPNEVEWD